MKGQTPTKAYKNSEFLNCPAAREVRILTEFLEPLYRFRKRRISNTIVVFGSARVLPTVEATKRLARIRRKIGKKGTRNLKLQEQLERAIEGLEMARYYDDAVQLTSMLTRWSKTLKQQRRFVICSGGGPGIMEAANKGAALAGGDSIGLNISLPFEQKSNKYVTKDLRFEFHYFFMRKFWFLYLAKALVMFPGGFGTFDELFEVLTLLQTKKVTKPLPVILYGRSYWNEVLNLDALVRHNTISKRDLELIRFADTPQEAYTHLRDELTKIFKSQNSMIPTVRT